MTTPTEIVHDRAKQILRAMEIDPEYFSAWEKEFATTLSRQRTPLSHKQERALEDLFRKYRRR